MVSPLLGRFLVSFNLQSAICGLRSAVYKCHTPTLELVEKGQGFRYMYCPEKTCFMFAPVSECKEDMDLASYTLCPCNDICNNNNNNNTYIALIRMRSKRFTSTVLQYDLEI